jgi:hypothetical protein
LLPTVSTLHFRKYIFYKLFFRFFKLELTRVKSCERNDVLRQIGDIDREILALLKKQQEVMVQQNANMQKALDKLNQLKQKRLE